MQSFFSSSWAGGHNLCLFPVLPASVEAFVQVWVYKNSSASFQLVFCENCSTCRCVFDVFVGRDELLLCHLDHPPNHYFLGQMIYMKIIYEL